jgi:endonuclease I
MKYISTVFISFVFSTSLMASCHVDDFYSNLPKASGYAFKTSLSNLLARTHRSLSYNQLHKAYVKTDIDQWFEADGTILDMYSESPLKKDSYSYKPGQKKCGNINGESSCYNREHLFPQGLFGKGGRMKTDIFHVYPTDGAVNNKRGSFAFGEVGKASWVSENGSKLGFHAGKGFSGVVFEPIDEFKGDIARAMLYFAVRYESRIPRFKPHAMTDGSVEQTYSTWFLNILIKWHKQDPVSEHEIFRNNAACEFQKNRNPFIDFPQWVSNIWEVQ